MTMKNKKKKTLEIDLFIITYISIIFNDLFLYLPKNNRKASMPAKMNTSMTSAGRTLSA